VRLTTGSLLPLPAPVLNRTPRRITFAFTTLRKLFGARDLTAVFRAAPIERLMSGALRRAHVPALREFHVAGGALGRFRLDFAVFCERGAIAVECDGNSSHRGPAAARTDRAKTAALTRLGWRVMRFSEDAIVRDARTCAARVRATARALGGIVRQTSAGAASPR
jgi:very-short-patch-repair endonuclease